MQCFFFGDSATHFRPLLEPKNMDETFETSIKRPSSEMGEGVDATSSKKKQKKEKKWWETKREKKKAKRELTSGGDAQAEAGPTESKQDSAAGGQTSVSTAPTPAAGSTPAGGAGKAKRKKKNKAMSQHATYNPVAAAAAEREGSDDDAGGEGRNETTAPEPPAGSTNPNALESYAERHSEPEPELLVRLRGVTKKAMPAAVHMTSGPLQGRLLKSLVAIKGAKRILEVRACDSFRGAHSSVRRRQPPQETHKKPPCCRRPCFWGPPV